MGKQRVEPERRRRAGVVKKQRASSMRTFYIVLVAVAVAGAGLIAWSATRPKSGSRIVDASVPAGSAEAWLYGNPDAPVQIVEFSDYECPACANFATITAPDVRQRIIDAGLANLRYYDFPLPQHGNSVEASLAAACAGDQGRYWEMHDRIFLGQPDWASERNPKGVFADYVRNLGLNVDQWEQCYDQRRHEPRILANKAYGERTKITSTPTFIIGRRMVPGSLSYDRLKAYVDSALADARTGEASTPSAPDTGAPAETTGR
jgi:protein-disulfide isomerase